MNPTTSKNALLLSLAALLSALGTGCAARTAEFAVTRPALMNLQPVGGTVSVGTIEAAAPTEATVQVAAELQQRLGHSLNPNLRLLAQGGAVTVDGTVLQDSYEHHAVTIPDTCTRTVDDGTDANGTPQSHSESYDCSYTVDQGTALSVIQLRIKDSARSGRVIFSQTYVRSSSYNDPGAEDVLRLRRAVRSTTVEQFARVLVPWQETVSERFKDCDGDDRCKKGFALVKAGDLHGADDLFSQVIGGFTDGGVVPGAQTKRIGEAFYDRAVTRAHQQRYDDAVVDLQKAIQLQPKRPKWPAELQSVQQMAADHRALAAQGAVP